MSIQLQTVKNTYTVDYPQAEEFRDRQLDCFWTHMEIDLGKDIQDIKINLTELEREAILTTLQLFSHYEAHVEDFWTNTVAKEFPRPEIISMATLFGGVEVAIHLPFYSKINKELGCHTDDFYNSYKEDTDLSIRMDKINSWLEMEHLAKRLLTFSFVEGALLYSSFAFLKSFQNNGRNLMPNLGAGISFSVRDESLHSQAAGWLFQQYISELGEDIETYQAIGEKQANYIVETETAIIEKYFHGGPIPNITAKQLVAFVKHRCDVVLKNCGLQPVFNVDYNPIAEYFYDNVVGYSQHDFFAIQGNQYSRTWNADSFNF